ncbi:MAG: CBS domain-containing protein [Gemmatimonadota bacterium]|jgi:CBS domain-containing protein|nr:CBS domain-containing protein [Gemmatimonadota bacterium]
MDQDDPVLALDIMTENPRILTPDATVGDAARLMRDIDSGIIPVVDSLDHQLLLGVVTDRDIAIRIVAEGKDGGSRIDSCMTTGVATVNTNDSLSEVLRVMRQERIRRVPVVDREGRLAGIIAQADLAVDYAARNFERESELADTIERISEPAEPRQPAPLNGRPGTAIDHRDQWF